MYPFRHPFFHTRSYPIGKPNKTRCAEWGQGDGEDPLLADD